MRPRDRQLIAKHPPVKEVREGGEDGGREGGKGRAGGVSASSSLRWGNECVVVYTRSVKQLNENYRAGAGTG